MKYGKINKDELGDDAWQPVSPTDYCYYGQLVFDASTIVPTSFENRPYSIRGLYLIAYWNITARARLLAWNLADPRGAFSSEIETSNQISGTGANNSVYVKFDANIDTNDYGNDMEGHAVGPDIKPYSVKTLYLISY